MPGRRWRLALLIAGVTAGWVSGGGPAHAAAHADFRDERLTLEAQDASLREVLDAVATATGATIQGEPLEERRVSLEVDALRLDDALHRLLGAQNFTLRYGRDGQPKAVMLLGGPEAPPPASDRPTAAGVVVAPGASAAPTGAVFPLALSRAIERAKPMPVPEPLAEALGQDQATMPELLDVATAADDGVVRAEATQAVLSALERQSRLRRSFLRTLRDLDDATLQEILAAETGPRFVGVIEHLAAHSREAALQKKAALVLERLRPTPPAE
jgi:hypothetical protein